MTDDKIVTTNGEADEISLVAFKYGESPFHAKSVFSDDTSNTVMTGAWLFYLIRYKEYNILVDTGISDLEILIKYGFHMDKFCEPVTMLKEYGLATDEITDVIITHSDFDHIGDINYYKNANIYIQEDEYKVCKDRIENNHPVHIFSTSLKIYDRFTVEHIGGHTVGSSIVTFKHGHMEYVLAGDECYMNANLEKQIPIGRSYDITKSREFIKKYNKPGYAVLLCHEPGIIKGDVGYKTILP